MNLHTHTSLPSNAVMRCGMDIQDLYHNSIRRLTGHETDRVSQIIDNLADEFFRHGVIIGSTRLVYCDTPGYILDICYHPYYDFHALFVPNQNNSLIIAANQSHWFDHLI